MTSEDLWVLIHLQAQGTSGVISWSFNRELNPTAPIMWIPSGLLSHHRKYCMVISHCQRCHSWTGKAVCGENLGETLTQIAFLVGLSHRGTQVLLACGSSAVLASGSSQACLFPSVSSLVHFWRAADRYYSDVLCSVAQRFSCGQLIF